MSGGSLARSISPVMKPRGLLWNWSDVATSLWLALQEALTQMTAAKEPVSCVCLKHIHVVIQVHASMHTHICLHIYKQRHSDTKHLHKIKGTKIHACMHKHTRTHRQAHAHTLAHKHTRTHTHAHKQEHTHTHTHKPAHTHHKKNKHTSTEKCSETKHLPTHSFRSIFLQLNQRGPRARAFERPLGARARKQQLTRFT